MKDLNEVLKFLNEIPNINAGGCGISALTVYKWLKKNNSLSDDFAIIYLHYWDDGDAELNSKFLSGKSEEATACSHAIFRYNGKLYDSDGLHNIGARAVRQVTIDAEQIDRFMEASLTADNWNPRFIRAQAIPLISKKVGVELDLVQC
jgi:hypothetical protein